MRKFKRFASAALAVAMTAATITACGSSTSTETTAAAAGEASETGETEAAASGDKTVVEVWTNDRHDQEYVQQMVDKYNAENTDNIQINMTVITEDYGNMLALAYSGGTAPDVIGTSGDITLNQFADTGIVIPLNEYIDQDEEYQKIIEPYEHQYEGLNAKDGNIYFVYSGMRSGVRVQYNKQLLEKSGYTEIPKTLDEYIAMANKITEDGAGQYYGIGFTSAQHPAVGSAEGPTPTRAPWGGAETRGRSHTGCWVRLSAGSCHCPCSQKALNPTTIKLLFIFIKDALALQS